MTIANNLMSLIDTKEAIKTSIINKGVDLTNVPFTDYPVAIDSITTSDNTEPPDWVRPSDWLPMPDVLPTEQKIVGLFPVFDNDSNAVAFKMQGNYTVDWGDGTVENFASGAVASRIYSYSNISDTTISINGYKQVIITITPQAGQDLTLVDFNQVATGNANKAGLFLTHSWLELVISVPKLSSQSNITFSGSSVSVYPYCESVKIISWPNVGINCANLFLNFYSLQDVTPFKLSDATNTMSMFNGCVSLKKLVGFDFSQAGVSTGTCVFMFNGCKRLEVISDTFNGAAITGDKMQYMFSGCNSLKEIPSSLAGAAPTIITNTFQNCWEIKSIPALNVLNVTGVNGTFDGCYSLESLPFSTLPACTSALSTFKNCESLVTANLSLPVCISINNLFDSCDKLQEVTLTTSSLLTSMTGLFVNCMSLRKVNLFNTQNVTSISTAFSGASSLVSIPPFNFAACTNFSSAFYSTYNMARIDATGISKTISLLNCRLSATELNRIFTNLPVVATSQTITVTYNPGAATCDPTIATAKGWTVTR